MPIYIRRILLTFLNALMIASLAAQAQQSSASAGNPAAAGTPAQADQPADREQQRQQQRRLAMLVQILSLTEDQKRQWLQIQKQTNQNVRATRKDDSLNEEQMQQKLKEIHAEQKRQLLALLAPQQQEALKKWWEEQRQRQQEKGASGSAAGAKDDDFFAGMVQDSDPPARPAPAHNQNKPATPPQN
ncbi:MAG TPA: hypothetical protein VI488_06115 [Candidatus Angelobacter sp.]